MPVDTMFALATAAFALGLSLATYRWFAVHNGWPMGEWQAHRPGLPIAIGLFCALMAMLFAMFRGGATVLILPLLGLLCALTWTSLTRVGAQSALLLAPAALVGLLAIWYSVAANEPERPRSLGPVQFNNERPIDRQRSYVPGQLEGDRAYPSNPPPTR